MKDPAPGDNRPKFEIAREAIEQMLDATEAFIARRPDFPIKIGLYSFSSDARELRAIAPYDRAALRASLATMPAPGGGTAIGDAMREARPALYRAGVFRKYLLVVTDGENTRGRDPERVARDIFSKSDGAVQIYFVAFDTSAEKFGFLKEVGGDVVACGHRARPAHRARRNLPGEDPGRSDGRGRARTDTEMTAREHGRGTAKETTVILHKFWSAFVAQINKVANLFWEADPIAQMRYEYDQAVAQLKEGRGGLEQYRGLVERVTRQVSANRSHVKKLEAETKAYLKAGDRTTAAKFALELQKAKEELDANEQQLNLHETAYGNSLKKIQHANEKLIELREKITKYDAELKMSAAEAEIAKLSETFNVNLTTDFGEIESVIQQRIDQNRGKVRVAADLSKEGIADIEAEERMRSQLAEDALTSFEVELGIKSPETTPVAQTSKDLGPAAERVVEKAQKQMRAGRPLASSSVRSSQLR